jgi:DNA-binding IclR family transcriptional regulator
VSTVDRSGIQVIARAATVLRCLEREPDGLSLGDIAARVDLPRSTVQRIVAALVEEQLLMSASLKARVKLGPGLVQLGAAADVGTEKIVRPFMQELSRAVDETVDLSVLRCTANGKALLTLIAPERRERLLGGRLKKFTEATVTDRAQLDELLREGEKSGLAYDLEEHSEGICAVGTAFLDSIGREYSLSIPVPASRWPSKRQLLSKLLKKTKADLLEQMVAS